MFAHLWDAHVVASLGEHEDLIAIDRIFLHERMGSVALQSLGQARRAVVDPQRVYAMIDHIVDTTPGRTGTLVPGGEAFLSATREACAAAGIRVFDIGDAHQGIVHVAGPELGLALPGATIVCPDSHTCTQGAMGALAWGIGASEAEHALATGTLRMTRPGTMRITVDGRLGHGVTAKDLALALLARFGADGGKGMAVEYAGEAVRAMDVEARMTLCNMATEFGAMTGLVAPDAVLFAWLRGRTHAPSGAAWDAALAAWRDLRTDDGATFDVEHRFDARDVEPMIGWGTSPAQSVAVGDRAPAGNAYMGVTADTPLLGLPIDAAFIGSCTNGRLSDLRAAAEILRGRHVAAHVRAWVVPGSTSVRAAAEAEGLDRVFTEAGFEWRESGCSMCFHAGGPGLPPGSRVVSSTNRNFEGRQGAGVRTHIASPATVAASALAGVLADPRL